VEGTEYTLLGFQPAACFLELEVTVFVPCIKRRWPAGDRWFLGLTKKYDIFRSKLGTATESASEYESTALNQGWLAAAYNLATIIDQHSRRTRVQ